MEKYKVTINNKVYEVEIERVDENTVVETTPTTPPKPVSSTGGATLNSPIQGAVLSVAVTVNQEVKIGQILLVIEAMKLENEIVADQDGVIEEVFVSAGQTVDNNQPLIKYRG